MRLLTRAFGSIFLIFAVASCGGSSDSSGPPTLDQDGLQSCTIKKSQVLNPQLKKQIRQGLRADLCDFGVFGWESFLYLVGPSNQDPGTRRFMVTADYPEYEGPDGDSCETGLESPDPIFNTTLLAAPSQDPLTSSGAEGEAGAGSVYAVEGSADSGDNVILYNLRFSRNLCSAAGPNLPNGLVEIKTAWRYLPANVDRSRYFIQEVALEDGTNADLGLVGFHLAQVTRYHPEMIWTTWEHVDNSPDCTDSPSAPLPPSQGWTMTTDECAACLVNPNTTDCSADCTIAGTAMNATRDKVSGEYPLQADPTNVCRVYPQGTNDNDRDADQNRKNINSLNEQVIGEGGYLAALPASDPQSIWQNYQMVGGLWFNTASDSRPPQFMEPPSGSNSDLQRGSLALTNTVMETTFQGGPVGKSPNSPNKLRNCFFCHSADNYAATLDSDLSHIAKNVLASNE